MCPSATSTVTSVVPNFPATKYGNDSRLAIKQALVCCLGQPEIRFLSQSLNNQQHEHREHPTFNVRRNSAAEHISQLADEFHTCMHLIFMSAGGTITVPTPNHTTSPLGKNISNNNNSNDKRIANNNIHCANDYPVRNDISQPPFYRRRCWQQPISHVHCPKFHT
ncbi:hypothetical protein DAPPUDRAFT_115652 [Daphnia pulex]|uniref:Uncharacterized protein n=1 Tax=Daphnia pulex TaxID=6669 RepID=E9HM42_DAPPU|nr:hypothetical protein DAPPUDRAFT_115652 [Daphnia pulex]|eukprot:EFX67208.1 hypothetical protein DAPPUDRAFT_115652 [Daphnia pulex]